MFGEMSKWFATWFVLTKLRLAGFGELYLGCNPGDGRKFRKCDDVTLRTPPICCLLVGRFCDHRFDHGFFLRYEEWRQQRLQKGKKDNGQIFEGKWFKKGSSMGNRSPCTVWGMTWSYSPKSY